MAKTDERKIQIIADGQKVNASLKEMQASSRVLYNQLRELPKGSAEFVRKSEDLRKVNKRINSLKDDIRGTEGAMKRMGKAVAPIGAAVVAAFSFQAIKSGIQTIINVNKEFERSLSSLSAITGATGEDLDFYNRQARDIGKTTTLSASQAVEAFKLMGSAKPELLANKEALAAVTQEAVTLAEAAGIELPEATQSLAGALNQFKLPASEAGRVINALAAGSKEGAAAIPEISQAIDKFGPVAQAFNVSVEESVGLVETLAESNIKGAEAGTALRNVLNNMAAVEALSPQAIEQMEKYGVNIETVSDKSIPLNKRLMEFSKISDDATALTKVFGKENMVAGQIILDNVDKFQNYTEAVTGTNIAYEQQQTNTDNLQGSIDKFNSSVEGLILSFNGNGGLTKVVRSVVDVFASLVDNLTAANQSIDEIKQNVQSSQLAAAIARDKEEVESLGAAYLKNGVAADEMSAKQLAATDIIKQYNALIESSPDQERIELLQQQIQGLQEYQVELGKSTEAQKINSDAVIENTKAKEGANEKELAAEKEKNERIAKLREEYNKSMLETDEAVSKLKIATIKDETERKLALIDYEHEQELEKIQEQRVQLLNNDAITKQQRIEQLALLNEQQALLEQEKEAEQKALLKEKRETEIADEMAFLEQKQQMEMLRLEESLMLVNSTEQREYEARIALQKEFLHQRLALLKAQGKGETLEAQKIANELLAIDKEQAEQKVTNAIDEATARENIREAGLDAIQDGLAITANVLSQDEKLRKKHGRKIKALQIANVTIDGIREIAAIWKNYNASPMNILVPGSGAVLAGIQTAIAAGRTAAAISQISAQKFAQGGQTVGDNLVRMTYDRSSDSYSWSGGRTRNVGSFASGGNITTASTGLIGEAGPEWVAPNWMLRSPAYADTFGWLESERQRKGMRAFAAGGNTAATRPLSTTTATPANPQMMQMEMMNLNKNFAKLAQEIRQWPKELRVINNVQDTRSAMQTLNEIESDSKISRSA